MKRQITMQNYFSTKKLNNENKKVDSSDMNLNDDNIIQGQDDITNNSGNNYDTTSSTDSYSNSDSESNIGDLIKEPKQNTQINVTSVLKKYPGPSDISQNLNSEPTQPNLTFYPKTKYGDRWRHFSKQWFKSFSWLEYSILEDAVYCFSCRMFSKHFDNKTTFISLGFKNWKKATFSDSGLKKHDKSQDHKNCYVMWVSFKNMKTKNIPSVSAQINEGHLKLIRENRKYIKRIASVLLYTGTQCIAQRGDDESVKSLNRGNFLELLHLIDEQCEVVGQDVPQNAKYTSPQIQNEMISIFNQIILEKISFELQCCNYFALIVDETKDISKTEQLSVVVRYYIQGSIHERFMGFKPAKQLNASSLLNYIKEILHKCSVDLQKCVAQTYDGAAVMSGRLNGVQKLFCDEVPQAIYVHCYNHKLNLVIADVCKNISDVKLFFDLVEEIYVFVSGSAVHSLFVDIQKKINLQSVVELKKICLTRWTAQVFATLALKKGLSPLLILLHKLINDKVDRSVTAKGLLHQIDFIFVLNLVVFSNILTMFKKVSDFLQGVIAEMAESMILIKSLIMTLKNMRNNSNDCLNECDGSINYICFAKMYEEALNICRENNISLPSEQIQNTRKKCVPQKYKSFFIDENISLENEQAQSKNDFRTKLYLPILDKIINELENRFSINSSILYAIDYLHPKNAKFLSYDDLKPLAQHYKLDTELLKSELKIIPNTINMYQQENKIQITNIMNFVDLLEKYKIVFNETYKMVIVSITIPVSSAGCERTFSCLRRLKTYMRNKMTDERLSNLSMMSIEKKIAKSLDLDEVVDKFAVNHNNRKIILV